MKTELEWENYGYMNGWKETPRRVTEAHNDPEAQIIESKIGDCEHEYVCEKYKFRYKVDSSD